LYSCVVVEEGEEEGKKADEYEFDLPLSSKVGILE
jgi:hypothetical protein